MSWLEQEESPAAAVSLVPLVEKPIALPLLLLLHLLVLVHVQVPRPPSLLTTREAAAAEDGDNLVEEKRIVEAENLKIITMAVVEVDTAAAVATSFTGKLEARVVTWGGHVHCSGFSSTMEIASSVFLILILEIHRDLSAVSSVHGPLHPLLNISIDCREAHSIAGTRT